MHSHELTPAVRGTNFRGRTDQITLDLAVAAGVVAVLRLYRHGGRRPGARIFSARLDQLGNFLIIQGLLLAEDMRYQGYASEALYRLHLRVSLVQVLAVRYDPMIGHQDRVILRNQRFERIGQLAS